MDLARPFTDRGTWRGPDEIAKAAQTAFEVSGGTLKARPLELVEAGADSVLGFFHVEASRPGATIDQDGLQRFVVRNGKIASLHNLFADVDEFDAFRQIAPAPPPAREGRRWRPYPFTGPRERLDDGDHHVAA